MINTFRCRSPHRLRSNHASSPVALNRTLARRLLWLALLIALCNALLPTAMRIASADRGGQVVTLCSAFGVKQLQIDAATGQPSSGNQSSNTCEYCLASQLACLPAVEHPAPALIARISPALPDPARAEFVGQPHWPAAQPRAPPLFS